MKTKLITTSLLIPTIIFFLASCGNEHGHGHEGHHHVAPHDGVLIECGDHQYNLEVVHDSESGDLEIYVLGGHASAPVRIKQESIEVVLDVEGKEQAFTLNAIADPQQDKTIGDTDYFQLKEALPGTKKFKGTVKSVTIKGNLFENQSFNYPAEDTHEH